MRKLEDELAKSIANIVNDETEDATLYLDDELEDLDDEDIEFLEEIDEDNDEADSEDEKFIESDFDEDDDDYNYRHRNRKPLIKTSKKTSVIISITMVSVVLLTVIIALAMIFKKNSESSYTFNYQKGIEYYNAKKYDKAIISFEKAASNVSSNNKDNIVKVNMYLYDCYVNQKMPSSAMTALNNVLKVDKYNEEALKNLARLYSENGKGQALNELLAAYKNTSYYSAISSYAIAAPVSNYESGTYDGDILVTLSCTAKDVKIYYTVDGSNPTVYAPLYDGSTIQIFEGTTELRVVAINETGIRSEVSSYTYDVSYGAPAKAVVSVSNGTYTEMTNILIENLPEGAWAYYTWDGSTPNKEDALKEDKNKKTEKYDPDNGIEMKTGTNLLKIVICSQYDVESEVATYSYSLNLATTRSLSEAVTALWDRLKEIELVDEDCKNKEGEEVRFVYNITERIQDREVFLLFVDYYRNDSYARAGFMYGVDGNSLETFTVTQEGDGTYKLTPIQ